AEAALKAADASSDLRERTARLVGEYRAKKADRAALDYFAEQRKTPATPPHEMDRRYAEAFRTIGIDIDTTRPADIGRQIRSRSADARENMIVTLDDWSMRFKPQNFRQAPPPPPPGRPEFPDRRGPPDRPPEEGPEEKSQDPERRKKILEAAIASDDHAWRNRLRRAILAKDGRTLDELSASIAEEAPPVTSLILLSHAVSPGEEINDKALQVLLQAY